MKNPELSELVKPNKSSEENLIKILFVVVIVGFGIILGLFYLLNLNMFFNYKWNSIIFTGVIIYLVRIVITFGLAFLMFRKWFAGEEKRFTNIDFLAGWFFFLTAIGKIIDLWRSIYYFSPIYNELYLVQLLQWRELLLIITFSPLIYIGLVPAFTYLMSEKYSEENLKLATSGIVITVIVIFGLISFSLTTLETIGVLVTAISFFSLIMITWLFWFIDRYEKLPLINSAILWKAFLTYLVISSLRAFVVPFGLMDQVVFSLVEEILFLTMYFFFFIGFTRHAKYCAK